MLPKSTTKVAVSPEKLPADHKGSTVVYLINEEDLQVQISNDKGWRIKQAAICACAIVLTTLILVAGTIGAITIALTHRAGTTAQSAVTAEGVYRDASSVALNEARIPDDADDGGSKDGADINPRILIENGWLLPPTAVVPAPASHDLVAVDGNDDFVIAIEENDIKIDDADADDNEDDDDNDHDGIDDDDLDDDDDDRGTGPVASGGGISTSGDGEEATDNTDDEDYVSDVSSDQMSSSSAPCNTFSDYYYDSRSKSKVLNKVYQLYFNYSTTSSKK